MRKSFFLGKMRFMLMSFVRNCGNITRSSNTILNTQLWLMNHIDCATEMWPGTLSSVWRFSATFQIYHLSRCVAINFGITFFAQRYNTFRPKEEFLSLIFFLWAKSWNFANFYKKKLKFCKLQQNKTVSVENWGTKSDC